jgi:outer membrane protein assembly factor BamB
MKKLLAIGLAFGLMAMALPAQERQRIYSNPAPLPREVLDRLNLEQAWRTFIPVDGRKDGFFSIQMAGNQVLVQTRVGLVVLLDAETGRTLWRAQIGLPYQPSKPVGFNSKTVFVINGTNLHALDRATGRPLWQMNLPDGITAPPLADEETLYLCGISSKIFAYQIPHPEQAPPPSTTQPRELAPIISGRTREGTQGSGVTTTSVSALSSAREAYRGQAAGIEPPYLWSIFTPFRLELTPMQTSDVLMVFGQAGTVVAFSKSRPRELYRFVTAGPLVASGGQFGEEAYFGSEDATLYALNMQTGKARWRFTAGTPIFRQPRVTEEDVYVVAERKGMTRVRRATGDGLWQNVAADRFLASNPKFVYGLDRSGRLLVIDRVRGRTLSSYDTSDFVFPVINEQTDRLYLAANNGLIVCLHDRDYPKPYRHRLAEELVGEPPAPVPGDVEKAAALKKRLTEPVTEPGAEPKPLRDLLADLVKRYDLKFLVPERAFKEANVDPIIDVPVPLPKVENVPLGKLLQQTLDPVAATYQVVGDTILIVPKPPKKP